MKCTSKYVKQYFFGFGYDFIEPYWEIMKEAEHKTLVHRCIWHYMFDAFIFDGTEPILTEDNQIHYWNKLKNELELYTAKKGKYGSNWKGGLSSKNHLLRNSKEYKEWRLKVFTRDNFTCQICGQVGGELNAHHIKHFSKDIKNRLNVDNGITLCADCHRNVHKQEGK